MQEALSGRQAIQFAPRVIGGGGAEDVGQAWTKTPAASVIDTAQSASSFHSLLRSSQSHCRARQGCPLEVTTKRPTDACWGSARHTGRAFLLASRHSGSRTLRDTLGFRILVRNLLVGQGQEPSLEEPEMT